MRIVGLALLVLIGGCRYEDRTWAGDSASVGVLRELNRLQIDHLRDNGSYACDLRTFEKFRPLSDAFLDGQPMPPRVQVIFAGYGYYVESCLGSKYEVVGTPLRPRKSGYRSYCTDQSGIIWKHAKAEDCLRSREPLG
jgi:hypothetical protein